MNIKSNKNEFIMEALVLCQPLLWIYNAEFKIIILHCRGTDKSFIEDGQDCSKKAIHQESTKGSKLFLEGKTVCIPEHLLIMWLCICHQRRTRLKWFPSRLS